MKVQLAGELLAREKIHIFDMKEVWVEEFS